MSMGRAGSLDPARHYDRVTNAWGLIMGEEWHYGLFTTGRETLSQATRRLTDLMIEKLQIDPGQHILDVGCGTGSQACRLAGERGAHVTGISTSEAGLAAARLRAQAAGLTDRLCFQLRDGTNNGLPDASIDAVWILESSHLMRERAALLTESARVLRAGGHLALCDIVLRRQLKFREVRERLEPLTLLREVFGDAHMEPAAHYSELARAAGLSVTEEVDLSSETRPTFCLWRENALANRAPLVELLGAEAWQQFVRACDVLERFWDEKLLGYALLVAVKP